jgi:hypothetical protein
MKYFPYTLLSAANDWIEQSEDDRLRAEREFSIAVGSYYNELEKLRARVSGPAWEFFRYGANETGLHDARLISATAGDGLDYTADGSTPFLVNRQKLSARIALLNFEQDGLYTFDLKQVSRFTSDLFFENDRFAKSVGDLYLCELTAASDEDLQLGFLFASGATIIARFRKIVFRRRRVKRKYPVGERFRP